jgi:hypothetical protein
MSLGFVEWLKICGFYLVTHVLQGAIPSETSGEVQTFIKEVLESSMKE